MSTTTIQLQTATRDRLLQAGKKGESYDKVLNHILDVAEEDPIFISKLQRAVILEIGNTKNLNQVIKSKKDVGDSLKTPPTPHNPSDKGYSK